MSGFGADAPSVFDPIDPFTAEERARREPVVVQPAPLFDPATGEVLDDPVTAADAAPGPDTAAEPAEDAHGAVTGVVLDLGPHEDVTAFTRALREQVTARIDSAYNALAAARPDGPIEVAVRDELRWAASVIDTLDAVRRVFADTVKHVKGVTADVVQEARPDRDLVKHGGTASLRMPARPQSDDDVKVTVTRATESWADLDAVLDVLVAHLIDEHAHDLDVGEAEPYGRGVRDGLALAREVTSPWAVKSTALDALARRMPEPLSTRLAAAYGRRPVDREPTVKVETVRAKP